MHVDRFASCARIAIALAIVCLGGAARGDESLFAQPPSSQPPTVAKAVRQANHTEPSHLPTSGSETSLPLPGAPHGDSQKPSGAHALEAVFSVTASLAAVLGLFFGIAWIMRRGLPSSATARLPAEVIEVLGRAPLAGRQQIQLLRLGNKLLLVCISPTGVNPLGEVTDPAEVERLAALCRPANFAGSKGVAKNLRHSLRAVGGEGSDA